MWRVPVGHELPEYLPEVEAVHQGARDSILELVDDEDVGRKLGTML